MFLIEMPLVFAGVGFLVGLWFVIFDIKEKIMGKDFVVFKQGIGMMIFSIILSLVWILIIKYTFIEGLILQCSEIEFFCK